MSVSRHLTAGALVAALVAGCSAGTPADDTTPATDAGGSQPDTASSATDLDLVDMTFMAGFQPQANLPFVGVYVAEARGFFAEEGLDVAIEHTGGGGEHLQLLAAGRIDVTTQDAAVLLERRHDPGLDLVSLALLGQTGQQAFVALAELDFDTPADWAGRTIGFRGVPSPDLSAVLAANGLTTDDVELVNIGFDARVLTEGLVDVLPVFASNEPHIIAGWGHELDQWAAADFGAPTLGVSWVATGDAIEERPEEFEAFVTAALRGVQWAEAHPDAAVDIVLTHTDGQADPAHQRFMLDTELAAAHSEVTDEHGLGWQTAQQWQGLADLLAANDLVPSEMDVTGAFTTEFLPGP